MLPMPLVAPDCMLGCVFAIVSNALCLMNRAYIYIYSQGPGPVLFGKFGDFCYIYCSCFHAWVCLYNMFRV